MPRIIEKNYAIKVELTAEDLKELFEIARDSKPRADNRRTWWEKTLKEWMIK